MAVVQQASVDLKKKGCERDLASCTVIGAHVSTHLASTPLQQRDDEQADSPSDDDLILIPPEDGGLVGDEPASQGAKAAGRPKGSKKNPVGRPKGSKQKPSIQQLEDTEDTNNLTKLYHAEENPSTDAAYAELAAKTGGGMFELKVEGRVVVGYLSKTQVVHSAALEGGKNTHLKKTGRENYSFGPNKQAMDSAIYMWHELEEGKQRARLDDETPIEVALSDIAVRHDVDYQALKRRTLSRRAEYYEMDGVGEHQQDDGTYAQCQGRHDVVTRRPKSFQLFTSADPNFIDADRDPPGLEWYMDRNARRGPVCALSPGVEADLREHILKVASKGFGLKWSDVPALARRLGEHVVGLTDFKASHQWVHRFRIRNPDIVKRVAEVLELTRASGMNKDNVEHYFHVIAEAFQLIEDMQGTYPNQCNTPVAPLTLPTPPLLSTASAPP
jgi:hypothetical protein